MKIIVPLAGPDFEIGNGRTKSEVQFCGRPLLRSAIESRPWWKDSSISSKDLIFILQDRITSRFFAENVLKEWYPFSKVVLLGTFAKGAALSALAGLSLISDANEMICVDLADILYTLKGSNIYMDSKDGGIVLVFKSDNPIYSYLKTDAEGRVLEAAEKRVISDKASAGTYFFKSPSVMLRALADNLDHEHEVLHRGLFYVCPMMNGVVSQGLTVRTVNVTDVTEIKTQIKQE